MPCGYWPQEGNAIITLRMNKNPRSRITTGSGADLAFAIVVLTSYFVTFSSLRTPSTLEIAVMSGVGIAYISLGIYGYSFCQKLGSLAAALLYFTVQMPLAGVIIYLAKGAGFNALIMLPLAGQSVVLLPTAWMYAANLAISLTYVLAVYLFSHNWIVVWSGLPGFMASLIFVVAFIQMAVNEAKSRMKVEELVEELSAVNQRLREYALQVEELTLAKERNRLAREIHDGLGHYLTTIHMQIQAACAVMKTDTQRAMGTLQKAQSLTEEALADVRRSVAALRVMPDEALPMPERIKKVLKNWDEVGIHTEFEVIGNCRPLNAQAELTFYRATQECLNNASKHGHATRVQVVLDYSNDREVLLTIEDDGKGSQPVQYGFGLMGLQERVHLLNGEMNVFSENAKGFKIELKIPDP